VAQRLGWLFGRFSGRIPRATFWWASLTLWLAFAVLFVFLDHALGHASTLVLYPFLFWGQTAIGTKRLHDRGQRGWRLLLMAIPVLGPLWLCVALGLLPGTRGDNQYGDDPLTADIDYLIVRGPA
jgi:uncharacterized membrane protein YhaH (DUF805 family)